MVIPCSSKEIAEDLVSQVLNEYSQFNSKEEVRGRKGIKHHNCNEYLKSLVLDAGGWGEVIEQSATRRRSPVSMKICP